MLISKFNTENICKYILTFEKCNRIVFPKQYRYFLERYNGGFTPKTKFRINKISSDIRGFYGLGYAEKNFNYDYINEMGLLNDYINDGYIPIALNSFGDRIVLKIIGEDKGQIFFFYHDRPRKYIFLEVDFFTFISKCKSQKIGHIRSIEERKQALIANGFGDKITPEKIAGWQAEIDLYANIHQEELII